MLVDRLSHVLRLRVMPPGTFAVAAAASLALKSFIACCCAAAAGTAVVVPLHRLLLGEMRCRQASSEEVPATGAF
jgi:L-alanine-DL-glutamate epimerase-like enolase superfamily enzyme